MVSVKNYTSLTLEDKDLVSATFHHDAFVSPPEWDKLHTLKKVVILDKFLASDEPDFTNFVRCRFESKKLDVDPAQYAPWPAAALALNDDTDCLREFRDKLPCVPAKYRDLIAHEIAGPVSWKVTTMQLSCVSKALYKRLQTYKGQDEQLLIASAAKQTGTSALADVVEFVKNWDMGVEVLFVLPMYSSFNFDVQSLAVQDEVELL